LRRLKRLYPWLKVVFADSAYDRLAALLACFLLGLTLVVIRRLAGTKGFVLLPRRWVAERTLGWLGRWRRLAKEYEELPEVSKTMVKLAMIRLMLHRLPTRTASDYPHPDLSNGLLVGFVLKAIEPIWTTKPETASQVRGRIESILDWATARGYREGENPAR
jgi:putative transposase